ncbi:Protein of unknown function DUF3245 [Penicillium argentinense]|uniref:Uncharacterized protein n=1 Tax=Penicillium argentinense TaxID=1131581 RepID=A0A9W9K2P7_9EURO|nr:Protein of unknown function DUF3245 [Penicillium argentinense]KAJ5090451.1 Protein of unknown function DUF3245 [Penicillium argentinense]
MSLSKSESDIILNRANVVLSRSQRLVSSWLPQEDDSSTTAKTDEELQREEDEIFTAVPETLGVGAPLPEKAADGSWNRSELSSNDMLRKQLLGRNYQKVMKAKEREAEAARQALAAKAAVSENGTNGAAATAVEDEEDDDEEGRAAMVGKRRRKNGSGDRSAAQASTQAPAQGEESAPAPAKSRGKKKATSYLDEILAQRANKKKKR